MAGVNGKRWYVTAQQETNRTDAAGRFVGGVLVSFQTTAGPAGSVFLPDSQYNPEMVKQAIEARVSQLLMVHALEG